MNNPSIFDAPRGSLSAAESAGPTESDPFTKSVAWTEHPHETRFKIDVARRELENGYVLLFAMDVPGVHAQGRTNDEALAEFCGVLDASLEIYREGGGSIPFEPVPFEPGDVPFTSLEVDA